MKVYCLMFTDSDGCSYSFDVLIDIFASKEKAETEVTRLELIDLELKEFLSEHGSSKLYKTYTYEQIKWLYCTGNLWVDEREVL